MRKPKHLLLSLIFWLPASIMFAQSDTSLTDEVLRTMKKATQFMVDKVSNNGGYVWNYTPDLSRQWGEMEAKSTMIWTQPPGTPSMGNLFLDAYHATGDEYYYQAAEQVANALIWGQLDCGGWNYIIDFAGEPSLKDWYATIGKNGWRLEEFQHYYGNATFDDDATYAPSFFLLRLYNEKHDPKYKPALDNAIDFILDSQYPIGGWPQRYPLKHNFPEQGKPDYTSFITLNDGVHRDNVRLLMMAYESLGDSKLVEPIRRAMNCILLLQQGPPQSGWSWQFTTELKPAGARTYEPWGLYSGATYHCVNLLMDYYEVTGETKFLARIPDAISFLESIQLPESMKKYYPRDLHPGQNLYPSCVEVGTNQPLYVHRRGSNAENGEYYANHDPELQWMPTFSMRALNLDQLKERYNKVKEMSPGEVIKNSPLNSKIKIQLPEYVSGPIRNVSLKETEEIIHELDKKPYWEGIFANSNPYIGDGPLHPDGRDYRTTQVGDKYDTSPYRFGEDFKGISTREYITNMFKLICYLNQN